MTTLQEKMRLPEPIHQEGHELIMATMLTTRMLSMAARALLGPLGFTEAQFNVLMLLQYQFPDGITQVELSKRMVVNKANITGLVDRMERDGLVKRTAHPTDRRAHVVKVTTEGGKRLVAAEKAYMTQAAQVEAKIPAADRKVCLRTLLALCELAEEV